MVGLIAKEYNEENDPIVNAALIQRRLFDYSDTLNAWAEAVSSTMIQRAADADFDVWERVSGTISQETRNVLKSVDKGAIFYRLQAEQVDLIKSIPLEAAKKVHEWVRTGLDKGQRYDVIAKRIRNELGVETASRAVLIARTETARARSNFTQARAEAVGSTEYRWHTVGDAAVRPMHKRLNNTIHRWDEPPLSDYGKGGSPVYSHPGCVWNCRCFAEPLFYDEKLK